MNFDGESFSSSPAVDSFCTADFDASLTNENSIYGAGDVESDNAMEQQIGADNISFGASDAELQAAANLSEIAKLSEGTLFGKLCEAASYGLSGSGMPGMEMLKEKVNEVADFYNIEPVDVFYERGELGLQTNGYTSLNYDNWIGGDPQELAKYSAVYGEDFITNVIAHETGHQIFDRLGLSQEYPLISNEACADVIAALHAGAKGLDIEGICAFLRAHPGDGISYPVDREGLFREYVDLAVSREWNSLQDIVKDPCFDLRNTLISVAEQYC